MCYSLNLADLIFEGEGEEMARVAKETHASQMEFTTRLIKIDGCSIDEDKLTLLMEVSTSRALFNYTLGSDTEFRFDLISEVVEKFDVIFAKMVENSGYKLGTYEDDESYFNILVPK